MSLNNELPRPSHLERSTGQHIRTTREQHLAYVLLRLLVGVNLFGHGAIRIFHGVSGFAAGMVKQMADTPLPQAFVSLFGHTVPWTELVLGALLIAGVFTRQALIACMLFLTALMFGITLKQDWPTAGLQLLYGAVVFALLYLRESKDASWLSILRPPRTRA